MDKQALQTVLARIDGYRDHAVWLETELTALPALGPDADGDGEIEKAKFLKKYLEDLEFKVDQYDAPDKRVPCGYRPNLVAMLEGKRKGPVVWIMTHTDVVPPGDMGLWTGDPWKVRVKGDRVIGRGVEDNQGGMVSSLLTVKAFREAGVTPELPIGIVLVADEETGSKYGLDWMLRHHGKLFKKSDIIIIPDSGNPKGTEIEVAEKSIFWVRVQTTGKQTHGSTPERGINAAKAASYLATRMETLYHHFRKRDELFEPPISTFELTKREANVGNVNTIPGEDVMYFDCRVLPSYKLKDVEKKIREFVRETQQKYKVKIALEFPQTEVAAPPTPEDAPVVTMITRAVKQLRRRTPKAIGIGGGTVAKFFREAGFPCAVWATMDERAHTPDEYAVVPYLLDDAKVFAHVAMQDPEA